MGQWGRGREIIVKANEKEDGTTSSPRTRVNEAVKGRGFGRGRGKYVITCYRCGVEGNKALECLEKQGSNKRGDAKMQMTVVDETSVVEDNVTMLQQEQGENIMFRRVL